MCVYEKFYVCVYIILLSAQTQLSMLVTQIHTNNFEVNVIDVTFKNKIDFIC